MHLDRDARIGRASMAHIGTGIEAFTRRDTFTRRDRGDVDDDTLQTNRCPLGCMRAARVRGACQPRTCVLRVLRQWRRHERVRERDHGGVDARRHAYRAVDAEQLPRPAGGVCAGHSSACGVAAGAGPDALERHLQARGHARRSKPRGVLGGRSVSAVGRGRSRRGISRLPPRSMLARVRGR